jgi:predicted phosphodiesterase
MKKYNKILTLGDIHAPFVDLTAIKQAFEFNKKFKADIVVCTGDIFDQKAWSRFLKDPSDLSPKQEWDAACSQLKEISSMFPKMTIILGNHDRRYVKKAKEVGIVEKMLRPINELLDIPNWSFHTGPNPLVINDIVFFHGDELPGGVSAKVKTMGRNVVQGHTHKGELFYITLFDKQHWGMDVGSLIDQSKPAFDYSASYLSKCWVGFGYIENGIPHLIPKKK